MTRVRRTLYVLLALTLVRIPLGLLARAVLPNVSDAPLANYAASMVQSLLLFALPGWLLKPTWQMPRLTAREGLGWGMLCVGAAVTARAVITPLNGWWMQLWGEASAPLPAAGNAAEWVMMTLGLAVVPAVAEEFFFRGALLPRLLTNGSRGQAAAVTTLAFALLHGSRAGILGHLLMGLLLTLMMMHSGRLLVPIAVHMIFNLTALWWPEFSALLPWGCGVLLAVMLLWLGLRTPRGRERRLPAGEAALCGGILLAMAAQYLF